MARMYVEGWAPDYGAPFDPEEFLAPAEGSVDLTVERADWEPLPGHDDGLAHMAFVDGVRRIDARLTIDDPEMGPVPGVAGSYAVGATIWDREAPIVDHRRRPRRARRRPVRAAREVLPAVELDPPYRTETIDDPDLEHARAPRARPHATRGSRVRGEVRPVGLLRRSRTAR